MNRQIPINRVVLGVLLVVLTPLYAPFSRSFTNKNRNSDTKGLRFYLFCGIIELKNK